MYVGQLKNLFVNILTGTDGGIMNVSGYADIMAENFKMTGRMTNVDWGNIDSAVTAMNSFSADQWETLKSLFPAYAGAVSYTHLPVLHGFLPSLQNRRQNHPQRYRFHSFSGPCQSSPQVYPEDLYFQAQSFFLSDLLPFLPPLLRAVQEWIFHR